MTQGFRRGAYLAISLGIVSFFGGYVLLFSGGAAARGEIARIKAAARKTGMPMEVSDLGIHAVPAALNAAPLLVQADGMTKTYSGAYNSLQLGQDPNANPVDMLCAEVAVGELQPYFDLLGQAAARPDCYFPKDWNLGAKVDFPEFAGMKRAVRDMCFKADLQDRSGDQDGALKTLNIAYKVAVEAGSEPITISMLVENSSRSMIDKEWETMLARHSRDPQYVTEIETAFKTESQIPQMKKYLGGEVVFGRIVIQTMTSLADLGMRSQDSGIEAEFVKSQLVKSTAEAKYLSAWSSLWAKLPADPNDWQGYSTALREMDQAVQSDNSISNMVTQILMPAFTGSADSVGILIAHEHMLNAAIALAKIRNQTGAFPVVIPAEISKDAIDPFDGNLLRYRRDGAGFVLYSIGADRIDNGGIRYGTHSNDTGGYDEVVSLN